MVKDKSKILEDKVLEFSEDDLGFDVSMLDEELSEENDNSVDYEEFNKKLAKTVISYDNDSIEDAVREWTERKIGKSFKFRKYQCEAIVKIIKNILDHKYQNYITEAPTGSGKSLINIISAGVLADYFDITSYILVSDLFLWEQYDNFLKKHKHTGIAILKGQTGNYCCKINNEDIKNADCRMAGLSWASLFNKTTRENYGYDCALTCEYVKARKKAVRAKVCIMTYQLFLFIMNNAMYNTDQNGCPIFAIHDVIFCDECHNIPGIVQQQYSPVINKNDIDFLKPLYFRSLNVEPSLFEEVIDKEALETEKLYKLYPKWEDLEKAFYNWWKVWTCVESRKDEDIECNNKYLEVLIAYEPIVESIRQDIITKKNDKKLLTKDDIKLFKICSWYANYMCLWEDFCKAIMITGNEYLLKDVNIDSDNKSKINDNDITVTFKCTKEDYIVWNFFLTKGQHKVMLSATVGTKDAFDERMGFKYEDKTQWDHANSIVNESYMETIPSTFDFEKSPVFFLNKFKMSFRERENSFRHLKRAIYSICETKFKCQKGMIQTGSYEFAKRLYDDAPQDIKDRMLTYRGSREKINCVRFHQISKDTILVGPTLNTGIDLPGDDCRFIIILKVPYPTLVDPLVHERNKLYPLWYNSHTSNEIIQGIGRGVRYNGDWCVTYIFDACFDTLYRSTKNQYPPELQDRIKTI